MRILQMGSSYEKILAEMGALAAVCGTENTPAPNYPTPAEALESERFDGVAAGPLCTSAEIIPMLEAKKHVFAENPAYLHADWTDMTDTARKNRVILACSYPDRFNPALNTIRDCIKNKTYGDLVTMQFWRGGAGRMMEDVSIHCMDAAFWLSGMTPHVVFARGTDNHATVMAGYDNNITTVISCSRAAISRVSATLNVTVSADLLSQETEADGRQISGGKWRDPRLLEMQGFADAINGKKSHIACPQEAADTARAARAALLSSQKGIPVYL